MKLPSATILTYNFQEQMTQFSLVPMRFVQLCRGELDLQPHLFHGRNNLARRK
jgi:hypothetical protein